MAAVGRRHVAQGISACCDAGPCLDQRHALALNTAAELAHDSGSINGMNAFQSFCEATAVIVMGLQYCSMLLSDIVLAFVDAV